MEKRLKLLREGYIAQGVATTISKIINRPNPYFHLQYATGRKYRIQIVDGYEKQTLLNS